MVTKDFQNTEIGTIPSDWSVTTLDTLFNITSSKRVFQSEWRSSGVPFYRARELVVLSETGAVDNELFISREMYDKYTTQYGAIQPDDILITGVGSLGKVYVVKSGDVFYFKDGNIIWLQSKHRGDSIFIRQLYFTSPLISQIFGSSAGTTVGTYTISNAKATVVPFPPFSEQRAIATALSDTDAYIAALEKLIAKKRAVKQGAMQELLTGKRRLPGFSGEWVEKPLCRIMHIKKERLNPYTVENTRCIELEHIEPATGHLIGWTDSMNQKSLKAVFEAGDVLFGKLRPYLKKYLLPDFSGLCSTEFLVFTAYDDFMANSYIYHLVQTYRFLEAANSTTGTKMPRADWSLMKEIEFCVPKDINEQTAIAEVLSDMNAEIDALTTKLNKAKQIKQGMMSELLTGRIRLVEAEPVKATVEAYPEAEAEPIRQVAEQTTTKKHPQQFDDAVMIAGIVSIWAADNTYPLGRKKTQKLLYLLRRHQSASTEQFHKKAAGPYADTIRYKGGEPIAISRKYIVEKKSEAGSSFSTGSGIKEAFSYLSDWGARNDFIWLKSHFHFTVVDDLELLTTIDMAICDLNQANIPVTVDSIKCLIATSKEWKAKLKRETFSDANIARAIHWSNQLFGTEA